MRRAAIVLPILMLESLILISCGGYSTAPAKTTGIKLRALVSQDVFLPPTVSSGLIVVDAQNDLRVPVQPLGSGFLAAAMVVSNDRKITVAVSSTNDSLEVMDNTKETTLVSQVALPGTTDTVVISIDNATGYAAIPTAPVSGGGSAGGIALVNLVAGGTPSTLPIPAVHYLAQSGDGSKLLAFSDNSDSVTIVSPFNIVPGQKNATCPSNVCTTVAGFDRPVFGFFSSDNTQAWILNCGPECSGVQASVQVLDLVHGVAGQATPVPGGATVGFMKGQTLYVAGNPPVGSNTCAGGPTTAATTCGRLTSVDLTNLSTTPIQPIAVIPDGYHTHLDISGNGQLFVGSSNCTNIVPAKAGDEQRGCLAILNTTNGNLVIPPDNGDVTALQPITNRNVFYVVEGGQLRIYDTTTDKIYTVIAITIFGNAVDVKLIDF